MDAQVARQPSSRAADGTIIPVAYVRRGGRLAETSLPRHPLHKFDTNEHRQPARGVRSAASVSKRECVMRLTRSRSRDAGADRDLDSLLQR
jgi:hypothetical protein